MMRFFSRTARIMLGVSCAMMLNAAAFAQQEDVTKIEITTQPVAENIHLLNAGYSGNIGLFVGEQGIFMIDSGNYPDESLLERMTAAIANISPQPIRFMLNTHWHFDHVKGNEYLGKRGATLMAHENTWKYLSSDQTLTAFNATIPAAPKEAQPLVAFTDALTLRMNGDEMFIFHPGAAHTDGDALVYWRNANVLHTGDLYFEGMYPFIDIEHGGSINLMIDAATKVLGMMNDTTKIIPGHGPVSDKAKMQAYVAMLTDIRDTMRGLITEGKTLDEIVAANPTQKYDEGWGKGFMNPEQFTKLVYSDLIREKK